MTSSPNSGRDPDFVCLGTQRAGTSWLHGALMRTPGYWMPPFKEINHFAPGGPRQNLGQKLLGFHARLTAEVGEAVPDRSTLRWFSRLCLAPRMGPAWYRSLFAPAGTALTGDISPIYFVLPPEGLARMAAQLPAAKVVVLLREPLERALSQRRFMMARKMWPVDLPEQEVVIRLRDNMASRWSDYGAALTRIEAAFPGRVGVFFYDHLREDPGAFLDAVTGFLGRPRPHGPVPAIGVVNAAPVDLPALSPDSIRALARIYRDRLGALPARFPEPMQRWVAHLDGVARTGVLP